MNRSHQLYILKNKTLLNQKNKNKITLTNMLQNLLEKDTVGRETENFITKGLVSYTQLVCVDSAAQASILFTYF